MATAQYLVIIYVRLNHLQLHRMMQMYLSGKYVIPSEASTLSGKKAHKINPPVEELI